MACARSRHAKRLVSLPMAPGLEPLVLRHTQETPAGFLPDEVLGEAFYAATKESAIPGFDFGYLVATRAGMKVAIVPYFLTDFKVNTMLEDGWLKRLLGNAGFRMACVGHPCSAFGQIDGEVTPDLMKAVYDYLKKYASVISIKGFPIDLLAPGFVRIVGFPVAVLYLHENFWCSMSASRRRNLQRKRKVSRAIQFEISKGLPQQHLEDIFKFYLTTCEKSSIDFAPLSKEYFVSTSALSHYVLAYLNGKLVGFIQTICHNKAMVAGYIGLDQQHSREHGVYFSLVMRTIDFAIENKYEKIEMGETHYYFKKALGCKLEPNYVYFRHRHKLAHALMSVFSFLFEPSARELM